MKKTIEALEKCPTPIVRRRFSSLSVSLQNIPKLIGTVSGRFSGTMSNISSTPRSFLAPSSRMALRNLKSALLNDLEKINERMGVADLSTLESTVIRLNSLDMNSKISGLMSSCILEDDYAFVKQSDNLPKGKPITSKQYRNHQTHKFANKWDYKIK